MENLVRKLRGDLTQTELAKLAGVSQQAIVKYEKGRNPNIEIMERIAAAVGKKLVVTIEEEKLKKPLKRREASAGL